MLRREIAVGERGGDVDVEEEEGMILVFDELGRL